MNTRIQGTNIHWPEAVLIAADRVEAGAPAAQTMVTASAHGGETGFWRVTPGDFTTDHRGYVEFFHVLEGAGELLRDDGTVLPLSPGVSVTMEDGWRGRWVVRSTLVKVYAILKKES